MQTKETTGAKTKGERGTPNARQCKEIQRSVLQKNTMKRGIKAMKRTPVQDNPINDGV